MYQRRLIVQDSESYLFLKPLEGDVGFTPLVNEAGIFLSREDAIDTASAFFEDFQIFECFLTVEDSD